MGASSGAIRVVRRRPRSPATRRSPDTVAAVDLGSNSFHMVVARLVEGQVHVIDRIREGVRLAAGLTARRELTAVAQARALACLRRFGQRLRGISPDRVRVVGTNTLRQARNARSFLAHAKQALGHDVEVIPGSEEARLIYLGVAHDVSNGAGRRLVVDIGGGSTECIVGEHFEPIEASSLYMGCVGYSLRFFPHGHVGEREMERARIAARLEVQAIERRFRALGWQECRGSSGTVLHVCSLLRENGWSRDGITAKGLRRLRRALIEGGTTSLLSMRGLDRDRAAVLPGGVAILEGLFEGLGIQRMRPASGALREGLLFDLLGRIRHEDVRDQTIRRLSERYHVDREQAGRVERTALAFFAQVAGPWGLDGERGRQLLSWAAQLHEIGLSLGYTGYHKHSAYLVRNGDMPGFSIEDRQLLAALILGHRRKLPAAALSHLPRGERWTATRLCILLRLAVCLNRSRSPAPLPRLHVRALPSGLSLSFGTGWLEQHHLTRADLAAEADRLAAAGFRLIVK